MPVACLLNRRMLAFPLLQQALWVQPSVNREEIVSEGANNFYKKRSCGPLLEKSNLGAIRQDNLLAIIFSFYLNITFPLAGIVC